MGLVIASTLSNVINIANKSHSFAKWVKKKKKRYYENSKKNMKHGNGEDLEEEYVIMKSNFILYKFIINK